MDPLDLALAAVSSFMKMMYGPLFSASAQDTPSTNSHFFKLYCLPTNHALFGQ